jgi:hypothetical protein
MVLKIVDKTHVQLIFIFQGTYITSGMDLKELEERHNFPKIYFYGKYKVTFKIKNVENKVIFCTVLELNLIRPWEKPI